MKKKVLALVMALTTMTAMVGCGGSAKEASGTTQEADTTTKGDEAKAQEADSSTDTQETESTTASDSGKKWIIVTDTAFKPFEYTDGNGEFVGIDVDILAAVAEDQGFDYELQSLGWDASIAACQAGQADGMIAGASITEERKGSGWIFSDGYYDANQSMAVEASSDIDGFEDLNGKSVAVKTGTMSASYAEELSKDYDFTITYFEDSPTMYQAVVGGQVAACFDDTPIMASNIKDTGISMKILENTGNEPAAYGFAIFNAENQQLVDMFNAGLANLKSSGKYDEILAKYLGE